MTPEDREVIQKLYEDTLKMDKTFENIRDGLPILILGVRCEQDIERLRNTANMILTQLTTSLESLKGTHEIFKLLIKNNLEEPT